MVEKKFSERFYSKIFTIYLIFTSICVVTLPVTTRITGDILASFLHFIGSKLSTLDPIFVILASILAWHANRHKSTLLAVLAYISFIIGSNFLKATLGFKSLFTDLEAIFGSFTSTVLGISLITSGLTIVFGWEVIKVFLKKTAAFLGEGALGMKDLILTAFGNLTVSAKAMFSKKSGSSYQTNFVAIKSEKPKGFKEETMSKEVPRLTVSQSNYQEDILTFNKSNGSGPCPSYPVEKKANIVNLNEIKQKRTSGYKVPPLSIFIQDDSSGKIEKKELEELGKKIEESLSEYGVTGKVKEIHPGPIVTTFEFEPAPGIKVGKVATLQDDLAMSLKAHSIRIVAPIPKKGTIGIEVPNKVRHIVRLRNVLESKAFQQGPELALCLGKDTIGDPVVVDLAVMPHLLIAGATGTGKSVCINSLLISLLYKNSPENLGLLLIDPKVLELSIYDSLPHLKAPVITEPKKAKIVLQWAVKEMERRYKFLQQFGVRNIDSFNSLGHEQKLSKLVIIIDELADLMFSVGKEIEELVIRLAQKARAAGIHLIMATQRPSVDVVTGLIKANFPARVSFRVVTRVDSRTILDQMGAEKLLGKGDMLVMLPGGLGLKRVHGAFVSDEEVQKFVTELKKQGQPLYEPEIVELLQTTEKQDGQVVIEVEEDGDEELYRKALEIIVQKGQASTSMIQRALRIGYNRAARIIEKMEQEGFLGASDGVRPREVLYNNIKKVYPNI
ncbi:MAG: DNA translocase FtsK [Deltaproteobacteria bacterium]|nr:DNA translocase FtsK [Deltaproteobacteria bacterium]